MFEIVGKRRGACGIGVLNMIVAQQSAAVHNRGPQPGSHARQPRMGPERGTRVGVAERYIIRSV
jgi:hypothetical protein